MEDRLTPGAVAGITGGLIQMILGSISKALHITPYIFTDFGRILILGKPTQGAMAFIVGAVCHLVLATFFGVMLSYMIKYTTKRFYLLKGWGVGLVAYTFAFGSGTYFKMPVFSALPPWPALYILFGASIYGLVTAFTLKLVTDNFSRYFTDTADEKAPEHKIKPKRFHLTPSPAKKIKKDKKIRLKRPIKL